MKPLKRRNPAFGLALCLGAALFIFGGDPGRGLPKPGPGDRQFPGGKLPAEYAPGEVLVKFKESAGAAVRASILESRGSRVVSRIGPLDVTVAGIKSGASVEETAALLRQDPTVEYAEPNYVYRIALTPNDKYFEYQYALSNRGQAIGWAPDSLLGTPGADIKATAAWEETQGKDGVIIGIIDTGVDLTHPDLRNKIIGSGRDFYDNDFDASDDHGHGTMVAGVAAAESDNDEGIAGVAWNCKILPVKVLSRFGAGYEDIIAQGIIWAVDNGASVLNLSWGGPEAGETLRLAVKYAYDKNVFVTAAAGNENTAVFYPAAFDDTTCAVAATDCNDQRTTWSNFGPEIDVAAPGEKIVTTFPVSLTDPKLPPYVMNAWGTSIASAHVAGLAALIKSVKPWLKPAEIRAIIRYSADDVNAGLYKGKDDFIGYGRINMERALVPLKVKK